ncbi:MAG: radical SAM family heme chaperone HemW [Alphaproteobacteria bacterium]|nr:radical SAM family heme chaperone HemW [Alphaproteobacteria bacterium]
MTSQKIGIYIHWPFCLSKCPYCDFVSYPMCSFKKTFSEESFFKAYQRDMDIFLEKKKVTSLFFGGGTPSLMSLSLVEKLLNEMGKKFSFSSDIEISMEANPDAISFKKMKQLKSLGINRFSLGVQALNEKDLRFFKRTHSLNRAKEALEEMKSVFSNCSMDLIYARPFQTWDMWEAELTEALSYDLPHLSLYELTLEEGTPFFKDKTILMPSESRSRALLEKTWTFLKRRGLPPYEISNFAKKGFACRHNKLYWTGADYLGIGPAAHGRIGQIATAHAPKIIDWLAEKETPKEELSFEERAEEKLLMGLRLQEGTESSSLVSKESLQKAIDFGWLQKRSLPRLQPTKKGFMVLNRLIELLLV